jgi:predicted HNH restriction endonuclease
MGSYVVRIDDLEACVRKIKSVAKEHIDSFDEKKDLKYKPKLFEILNYPEFFYYCDDSTGITIRLYKREFSKKNKDLYIQYNDKYKKNGKIDRPGRIIVKGENLGKAKTKRGEKKFGKPNGEVKKLILKHKCFDYKEPAPRELREADLHEREKWFDRYRSKRRDLLQPQQYIPEEILDEKYKEGNITRIAVNRYERNPKARKKCIEHYGVECWVCDFNFEKKYGKIGEGYIVVHHVKPLSDIKKGYEVDPIKDLRPVCPNCHAMLHPSKSSILDIDKLKRLIRRETY